MLECTRLHLKYETPLVTATCQGGFFYFIILMPMINELSQIHIGGWMINELKLSGNSLIVFALIFSFTNGTNDHAFHGSANYIAEWCGVSRRAVMDILKKLVSMGLIERKESMVNGVKFVDYFTPCENSSHHILYDSNNIYNNNTNI